MMRLRCLYVALALTAMLAVLTGCRSETPDIPPTEDAVYEDTLQSPLSPTATPAPTAQQGALQSPLSPPATPAPTSGAMPTAAPRDLTPAPDLGIVQGVLLLNGEPAPDRRLYLAAVIASGEEMEVTRLDTDRDDRADSDASGTFVFLDVAPGRYALAIEHPSGPVLISGDDGSEIVAEVEAGQITDLGIIKILPF